MSPIVAQIVFWTAAACCFLAQVALVQSAVRSPMAGSRDTAAVVMPRRSSEIAWSIVPAIALALVLAFTWRAMHPTVRHEMHLPAGHRMIEE
jgi:hypothetical protein